MVLPNNANIKYHQIFLFQFLPFIPSHRFIHSFSRKMKRRRRNLETIVRCFKHCGDEATDTNMCTSYEDLGSGLLKKCSKVASRMVDCSITKNPVKTEFNSDDKTIEETTQTVAAKTMDVVVKELIVKVTTKTTSSGGGTLVNSLMSFSSRFTGKSSDEIPSHVPLKINIPKRVHKHSSEDKESSDDDVEVEKAIISILLEKVKMGKKYYKNTCFNLYNKGMIITPAKTAISLSNSNLEGSA